MRLWVFKRHFSTIFQLYIDLWTTFPGANMVQDRNTLGYLRTRTFYTPERKYAYKYTSITKCLTCSPRKIFKKIFKYPLSRPTKYSECTHDVRPNTRVLEGVDSPICRTFFWSESDILGGICLTWEYERGYTWSVLYVSIHLLHGIEMKLRLISFNFPIPFHKYGT